MRSPLQRLSVRARCPRRASSSSSSSASVLAQVALQNAFSYCRWHYRFLLPPPPAFPVVLAKAQEGRRVT
jgi:hypothetical protein